VRKRQREDFEPGQAAQLLTLCIALTQALSTAPGEAALNAS